MVGLTELVMRTEMEMDENDDGRFQNGVLRSAECRRFDRR